MEDLLPREVDALDPKSQLQLALRLASRAFAQSESTLQQENRRLRARLEEVTASSRAEAAAEAAEAARAAEVAAERERVAAASAARAREEARELAGEVRRLRAEVAKAEGVRKVLLRSLGESVGGEVGVANDGNDGNDDGEDAPARIPASYHPRKNQNLQKQQQQPPTATTMMSGKYFFRAARARLPAARFEALMAAVRALNGGRASRTAALAAASEALGGGDGGCCADLVPVIEGLLSQRVPVD